MHRLTDERVNRIMDLASRVREKIDKRGLNSSSYPTDIGRGSLERDFARVEKEIMEPMEELLKLLHEVKRNKDR